tara:strand:+ start:241 stop:627 length:387 start_codon:yes stop_codon:yes gene_type:complete
MNTPTPRTDAAWSATFNGEQMSAGQTARALREHSQQLETELAAITAERDAARARAERAEADLAALGQSFDDNCRGVVRIAAELATERARLDWLESNADDIMKYNCRSYIWFPHQNLRAAIDAGMKEGA